MDYYELPAEGRGYYMFDHRPLMNAKAHFHSAVEFIFMEKGYAEVNVGGERRLLHAGFSLRHQPVHLRLTHPMRTGPRLCLLFV